MFGVFQEFFRSPRPQLHPQVRKTRNAGVKSQRESKSTEGQKCAMVRTFDNFKSAKTNKLVLVFEKFLKFYKQSFNFTEKIQYLSP